MTKGRTIIGTDDEILLGRDLDDSIFGRGGDDTVSAPTATTGSLARPGSTTCTAGRKRPAVRRKQNDNGYGEDGNDIIHGDSGLATAKGATSAPTT